MKEESTVLKNPGRRISPLAGVIMMAVFMTVMVAAAAWLGRTIVRQDAPLVHDLMEVRLELALAHMAHLQSGTHGSAEVEPGSFARDAAVHLDRAGAIIRSMRPDARRLGWLSPMKNRTLQTAAGAMEQQIQFIQQQVEQEAGAEPPDHRDEEHNRNLAGLMEQARSMERLLQDAIKSKNMTLDALRGILILLCLGFGGAAICYLRAGEKERAAQVRALRRSERKLAITLDSIGDGVISVDPEGRIVRMNPVAERLTGWPEAEAAGKPLKEIFYVTDAFTGDPIECVVERVLRDGLPAAPVNHTTLQSRDGTRYQIAQNAAPIRSSDGTSAGAVLVFNDVTESYEHNRLLRESEMRLRGIFTNSSNGIAVLQPVDDGRDFVFLDFSPAAERFEGISREQVVGRRLTEAFPGVEDMGYLQVLRQVWQTGAPQHLPTALYRDGRIEGWRESHSFKLETGEVVSVYSDRTAEMQTQEERRLLAAAIEQSGEAVVITGPGLVIEYVNPAFKKMTGYAPQEVTGRHIRTLKSGEQDDAFYKDMWSALSKGKPWRGRIVNRRKNGGLYTEEMVVSPVRGESGEVIHYVAVKRDISEELEMESQLNHAKKMDSLGNLVGGVAHDFNNLLQVINGYAEIALMDLPPDHRSVSGIREIGKAGRQAKDLVWQLLAFCRRQQISPEYLDLNEVVTESCKMLGRLIGEHIEMEFAPMAEPASILADKSQIQQVLINLCVNARDAMPRGGRLSLRIKDVRVAPEDIRTPPWAWAWPGRYVALSVTDTGCGMNKEIIGRIFDPFFTTKEKGKGTGLGLATVYGIVKRHEGEIRVYSEEGVGTSFTVYLPYRMPVAQETEKPDGRSDDRPGEGITILAVEDEPMILRLSEIILSRAGYSVLTAANGEEALRIFEHHADEIDGVLMDVVMPRIGGKEAMEQILARRPDMRYMFVSGYSPHEEHQEDLQGDSARFLLKPYVPQTLLNKVRNMLETE